MVHEVIIVGGGMAGLTAGSFLAREGISPLLLEKGSHCGGLVNSFQRDGFTYDGGIRATEDSGILFPMLHALGIELDFLENPITLGLEDRVIQVESEASLKDYQKLLVDFFPESREEILQITSQMQTIMDYMEVQYGIKNPAFLDVKEDRDYFLQKVLPWMLKYALTVPKINRLNQPVEGFLENLTDNESLVDIITQHFFARTPAFFALSYLKIYLDYYYPRGGTGQLPRALEQYIQQGEGEIRTGIDVVGLDPVQKTLQDQEGREYRYRELIWAADLTSLYSMPGMESLPENRAKAEVLEKRNQLNSAIGNDSVLTVYLGVDLPPEYFSSIASGHFFYTPRREGESRAGPAPGAEDRQALLGWLKTWMELSTYEISIPVLRDSGLAPVGQTGLIISLLFDYHLAGDIRDRGWYGEFKEACEEIIIQVLDDSIYPGIRGKVLHQFSSTPLTLEEITGNRHGAITGWSFKNSCLPAESRLPKIFSATATPLPGIHQAGHWTYSPSGLPISILTGKLAADRAIKNLK